MSHSAFTRTCVSCNKKEHKDRLLRFTLPNISFDIDKNMQGRGFYFCCNIKCLNNIFKKRLVLKYIDYNKNSDLLNILKFNIKESIYSLVKESFESSSISIYELDNIYQIDNKLILYYNNETLLEKYNSINISKIYKPTDLDLISIVTSKKVIKKLIGLKQFIIDFNSLV